MAFVLVVFKKKLNNFYFCRVKYTNCSRTCNELNEFWFILLNIAGVDLSTA